MFFYILKLIPKRASGILHKGPRERRYGPGRYQYSNMNKLHKCLCISFIPLSDDFTYSVIVPYQEEFACLNHKERVPSPYQVLAIFSSDCFQSSYIIMIQHFIAFLIHICLTNYNDSHCWICVHIN